MSGRVWFKRLLKVGKGEGIEALFEAEGKRTETSLANKRGRSWKNKGEEKEWGKKNWGGRRLCKSSDCGSQLWDLETACLQPGLLPLCPAIYCPPPPTPTPRFGGLSFDEVSIDELEVMWGEWRGALGPPATVHPRPHLQGRTLEGRGGRESGAAPGGRSSLHTFPEPYLHLADLWVTHGFQGRIFRV